MTDPILFTPGPLTTSATVKAAMQRDLGSRDSEFIDLVARIRRQLLEIAGVSQESGYEAVLMQGSGTFALEAVLSSVIPPDGRLLVLANGAYGERMLQIAERLKIAAAIQRWPEERITRCRKLSGSCWPRNRRRRMSRSFTSKRPPES